ncbi:endonuclease domain-containing 1 protein-like [Parambassis ranga]|uniref:Endonuclease domain-containing 1 protein-like n=1 Tax=Parambassis ranga TaxID=210632 RepID=A0A6P7I892_9TELE|nr:endonuclease domain-containing 1 protein-like [Parambassis ranga]
MASVKVQGLLLLLLSAVLLLSISPTGSEVLDSVMDCSKFFLQQTPPRIPEVLENGNIQDQNRYKVICQTLNNSRTFVTVYDTKNKIPVFSASRYTGCDGGRPKKEPWKIEPQLEDPGANKDMKETGKSTYNQQAGDIDYKHQSRFDRGHLLPSSYGFLSRSKQELQLSTTYFNYVCSSYNSLYYVCSNQHCKYHICPP